MTKQSKALWMADVLDTTADFQMRAREAAVELRRLHEVNQELLGALETISDHAPWGGSKDKYIAWLISVATDAIAKATGETNE